MSELEIKEAIMNDVVEIKGERSIASAVTTGEEPGQATELPAATHEITHDVAMKIAEAMKHGTSTLDPEGKIILKTLSEMRKDALPPVQHNWERLAQVVYFEMRNISQRGGDPLTTLIPIKVTESMFTKKNKIRLLPGNHKSPLGIVLKNDEMAISQHKPYATALFTAPELFRYAISQLPDRPSWLPEDAEV